MCADPAPVLRHRRLVADGARESGHGRASPAASVVDAGALCELLLARGAEAPVRDALSGERGDVLAPELLDLEVLSVVRRLLRQGEISRRVAEFVVAGLREASIVRVPHGALVGRSWALRDRLTPYDAAYVGLAELGDGAGGPATLLTADARLARTVRSLGTVPVVAVQVP